MGNKIIKKIFNSQTSYIWNENVECNYLYLENSKRYFSNLYNARGFLLLNEVYKHFGLDITSESCIFGWIKGSYSPSFEYKQIEDGFELAFECYEIYSKLPFEERIFNANG